jgi:hypothetical protein
MAAYLQVKHKRWTEEEDEALLEIVAKNSEDVSWYT